MFQDRDQAAALLAAIVESSEDAIISKRLDGVMTSWNKAAERLLGYTREEALGKSVFMLIPEERHPEERSIIESIRAGRSVEHHETVRVTKDGRHLQVAMSISPVLDRHGNIVGAANITRDISERKHAENRMTELLAERDELLSRERAERTEAERISATKDEFLALLSHELRTPLNAILGWTQVLRRGGPSPPDLARGLEVIERNVRVQSQLVEDLLDMSRIVAGQMRLDVQPIMPFAFVHAAVDSLRPAADARGVRIEAVLDPGAGPVNGDAARLQQVIWNLVSNAIKFTPAGGRVQVTLERVNSHLEISVGDTGIGIKAEFLPHVFERFRQADAGATRKHGGLGLGLSIVKHIVELHAGTVQAKSPGEGQGSTFRVQLPLVVSPGERFRRDRQHPRTSIDEVAPARADLSGVVVLVVDDEQDARELIDRILGEHGATVVTAASADEALAAIGKRRPDVLVSDIGMPMVDGYELLRRVRALAPGNARIPAIALTAFARSEDRTRALLAGYLAHVAKPVDSGEIVATVAAVAGRT